MKKKLEAELISIAHRILKLKNRAELDQLQSETLKLYEKISVLRFVEDNFSDVKPTIGYASAEETLEEIYGIEEVAPVHANEEEAKVDDARAKKADDKKEKAKQGKENEVVEEAAVAVKEAVEDKPGDDAKTEQKTEEYQASEEEKEETAASGEDVEGEASQESAIEADKAGETEKPEEEENKEEVQGEEPEQKIEVIKPEAEVKAMEEGAAAVFEKEDQSTIEEEEKAADAEVITIQPDENAKTEESGASFDFAFERTPAPEEPAKQKEITFEDYHDYKEPEFVKKGDEVKAETPKENTTKDKALEEDDWRNWEPSKSSAAGEQPAQEEKKEELKPAETPKAEPTAAKSLNDSLGKTITLTLNDRIAFEKHLFGGSGDDLNRVLSQLTTIDSFEEAKNFIEDLVKPDYNNWGGKEEYETRFMEIVEKKYN